MSHKRKIRSTIILWVILIALLCGIGYCSYQYVAAWREYHHLNAEFITKEPEPEQSAQEETLSNTKHDDWLDIDYAAFFRINTDFTGVIYIPAIDTLYPIVQAKDNTKYLSTTFGGSKNASGCLFLDYRNNKDMSSPHSFIYGHNMKDGTMFGKLKNFDYDSSLAEENPYVYVYTSKGRFTYRIYAYSEDTKDDGTYTMVLQKSGIKGYIEGAISRSQFSGHEEDESLENVDHILTLSTCYGTSGEFFVVQCALETFEEY